MTIIAATCSTVGVNHWLSVRHQNFGISITLIFMNNVLFISDSKKFHFLCKNTIMSKPCCVTNKSKRGINTLRK